MEENQQEEEEDKIKTTMQSSVAMLQSCTHGPKQLFLSSKQVEEITTLCSLPYQCSRVVLVGQSNCFFPVNYEKMEEKVKVRRSRRR